MIEQLNETLYLGFLENLTSIGPRITATEECDEAGRYIFNEFKKMGLDVIYHNWTERNYYGSNIEATIQGLDHSSDEIYLICGHYDSVIKSPGADDDGSGTVGVITAAKIMSQYKFNHTLRFVTFSGEEQGLLGSDSYAEKAFNNNDNIVAIINLDMIGYTDEINDKVLLYHTDNPDFYWLVDKSVNISNKYLDLVNINVIPSGPTGRSDHMGFWLRGYNGIFLTEYEFNPYYHSSLDTIENMNISYATRISKLSMAILAEISELTVNIPPEKPNKPIGNINGGIETLYEYSTSTQDIHSHDIYYMWDWGDETSGWLGPYKSGETCEAIHEWDIEGSYDIKVKAKDQYGDESSWSDPLTITVPKKKMFTFTPRILLWLFERFPFLQPYFL
jgi:hypothetical protein